MTTRFYKSYTKEEGICAIEEGVKRTGAQSPNAEEGPTTYNNAKEAKKDMLWLPRQL